MQKPQRNNSSNYALFEIRANKPRFFSASIGNQLVRVWTKIGDMTKFISKSDLAEILDNVFSKYDIEMTETKTPKVKASAKVIKKTGKSKKTSSVKSQAKSESSEFVIDGEKFTLNGVFVTKGATYKKQTAGGVKLTTIVCQVTQEQHDAWEAWRKN